MQFALQCDEEMVEGLYELILRFELKVILTIRNQEKPNLLCYLISESWIRNVLTWKCMKDNQENVFSGYFQELAYRSNAWTLKNIYDNS